MLSRSKTPTYISWQSMHYRCYRKDDKEYARYGGKGITVCQRWFKFENFLADMGERPEGLTLERKENDKGYNLDNCRWATRLEQTLNRSNTVWVEIGGRRQCAADWCKEFGLKITTVSHRVKLFGWSWEKALTTPVDKTRWRKS